MNLFLDTVSEINVCYTANVNSAGNDIESRNGVASAEKCQEVCKNNRDCKYFVYGKNDLSGSCFLKSEKVDHLTQHVGLIFGPKECRKFSDCHITLCRGVKIGRIRTRKKYFKSIFKF